MSIDDLMQAAVHAEPTSVKRSKWSLYYPVLNTLVKRGFSKLEAVRWLAKEERLDEDKIRLLYNAWNNSKGGAVS